MKSFASVVLLIIAALLGQAVAAVKVIKLSPEAVILPPGPEGSGVQLISAYTWSVAKKVTVSGDKAGDSAMVGLEARCDPALEVTFDAPVKSVTFTAKGHKDVAFQQTVALSSGAVLTSNLHCKTHVFLNGVEVKGIKDNIVFKPQTPSGTKI